MKVLVVAEGRHELYGALEEFVRRLSESEIRCHFEPISRPDIHAHHGKGRGFLKRAVRWMKEASKEGYEALVLLIDEDGVTDRKRQIDDAQESGIVDIRRALGVAIRTFDAWMLADEKALTDVLNIVVKTQKSPENIRHPKTVCADLLKKSSTVISQREMYFLVAKAANIATLEKRCPKGFSPFAQRIRGLQS